MLNMKPRCTLIIGHAIDEIFNQCARYHCTSKGTMNLTERTRIRKAMATHQYGASGRQCWWSVRQK